MEQEQIVAGLDIGSTKVLVMVGKKNSCGDLEILGIGEAPSSGVVRGVITNLDKTIQAIKQAIKQAEETSGIDIRVINVGISGRHITSSIHHGSITRENTEDEIKIEDVNRLTKDMYKILTPPGNQIIHVIPQNYTVDYSAGIKDPIGMEGVRLEADFNIITASINAVRNIHKCTQRAGVETIDLFLSPLATSLAILNREEKEAGVCLLDIGGGVVNMAIFHDEILQHTANIPFAGNSITSDIKMGLQTMEHQAELLKRKFGRAIVEETTVEEMISIPGLGNFLTRNVSLYNLTQIVEARMEEIIELVHQEIIISGFHNKLVAGIVITGGGAQLISIKKFINYMTGIDTRIGYPNNLFSKSQMEMINNPSYAMCLGLLLAEFQQSAKDSKPPLKKNSMHLVKKEKQYFFKKILHRTKGLLIDDHEDSLS
jgi:cell division protein FtsA